MSEKMKTVPLSVLFGDAQRISIRFRIGISVLALMEALVVGYLVWRAFD